MTEETTAEERAAQNKRKLEEHLARLKEGKADFSKRAAAEQKPQEPPKPPPRPSGWDAWKKAHKGRVHNISVVDLSQVARDADFGLLDLKPGASKDEVRKAFNILAKKHHPDLGGDAEIFQAMRAAHDRIIKE